MPPVYPRPLTWTDELVATFWAYYARSRQEDYFTHLFGDRILELTERYFKRTATVCDYGCGSGHLLERLLTKYQSAGYDLSAANVTAAAARLGGHPNLIGVFQIGGGAGDSGQYDAVYLVETVEHLLDRHVPDTMRRLRSLLKERGVLIATTPNNEDLSVETVFCPRCQHSFHRWQHVRSFDAERLSRFMAQGGFEPVDVFTTDFSARTPAQRLTVGLRRALGRKNPHLVWVGRKAAS